MAQAVIVKGDERAARMIGDLGRRARKPARFEAASAEVLREGFRRQIATSGGYYGGGWQGLASVTLDRKAREGYPATQMLQTGSLRNRVLRARARATAEGIAVGLGNDPVAGFHQSGTGNMPSRQLIGMTAREPALIRTLGIEWIMGRFGGGA